MSHSLKGNAWGEVNYDFPLIVFIFISQTKRAMKKLLLSSAFLLMIVIVAEAQFQVNGITVAGGNGAGNAPGQIGSPYTETINDSGYLLSSIITI